MALRPLVSHSSALLRIRQLLPDCILLLKRLQPYWKPPSAWGMQFQRTTGIKDGVWMGLETHIIQPLKSIFWIWFSHGQISDISRDEFHPRNPKRSLNFCGRWKSPEPCRSPGDAWPSCHHVLQLAPGCRCTKGQSEAAGNPGQDPMMWLLWWKLLVFCWGIWFVKTFWTTPELIFSTIRRDRCLCS